MMGGWMIGLDVTDAYLRRSSAMTRFRVWMNRHITGKADIHIYTGGISQSRDEVLAVLLDRFDRYELRSISEVKKLERNRNG